MILRACVGFTIVLLSYADMHAAELRSLSLTQDAVGVGHRKWENGYLAAWDLPSAKVFLFDSKGTKLWSTAVSLPDAKQISIATVSIWPDGSVVAAGGSTLHAGDMAGFLAMIRRDGTLERIVNTTPYVPWHMKALPSGVLWCFGRMQSAAGAKQEPDYKMVRAYSRDGRQLLETLPRSEFGVWPHPAVGAAIVPIPNGLGVLAGSYSELIEIANSGEILARKKLGLPGGIRVLGGAIGPGGLLYVSGTIADSGDSAIPLLGSIELSSGRWTDLRERSPAHVKGAVIIGVEGAALVVSDASREVRWIGAP